MTLLTDRDAAIPVLNTRSGARSAAFGGVPRRALLEMRFMAGNADVQVGDLLTTSGVDGVYPPGLRGRHGPDASTARSTRASPASPSSPRPRPTACATS